MISIEPCQITTFLYAPNFKNQDKSLQQKKKKNQGKYATRKKKGKKGRKNCNFAFGYGAKLKISSNQ